MTLEGANNFSEGINGTIFTMNGTQTGQYCVVIPNNTDGNINILVDLNMKKSFDSLMNNTINKDSLVKEINDEYDNIVSKYPGGVLVLPMFDIGELTNSINSNDKQKMFDETKKIGSITSELYKKMGNAGIDKSKIDQRIILVEKTDIDNKFVAWLKEQMPNFVDGVSYDELNNKDTSSNENVNPFTGEAVSATPEPVNDIFSAPVEDAPVSQPAPVSEESVAPEIENVPVENKEQVQEDSTSVSSDPVVEPQPVTETKLETTQAVPTVDDNTDSNNVEPVKTEKTEEVETHEIDKKSGGFANLLILLVILVVVTVVSIELGKFLYNTFGA